MESNFCSECAINILGTDTHDFSGLVEEDDEIILVDCASCGEVYVDINGVPVDDVIEFTLEEE